MSKSKRLIYLVSEDWYFISHRLQLAVAAKNAGYKVAVVTRCSQLHTQISAKGIRVIPLNMMRRGLNPLGLLCEMLAVARIYRRLRPVIVHHVALRPVIVGGMAARLAKVPKVISAIAGFGYVFTAGRGGWLAWTLRWLLSTTLARGRVIVQNSDDCVEVKSLGVSAERIVLIPGAGVDVTHFIPRPEPEGIPVVMLASRLLWDKGVGEFVEAARILKGRARFVLVGKPDPGNPASLTNADVCHWVDTNIIEYWGQVQDMPTVLNAAHVICLPSYREGLPKVLLEAMACGRACVTTDVPGCRDAVRGGDNGLLFPIGNVKALANAIETLLADPVLRRKMGGRGRHRAVAEFSQERVIAATLALYSEMRA